MCIFSPSYTTPLVYTTLSLVWSRTVYPPFCTLPSLFQCTVSNTPCLPVFYICPCTQPLPDAHLGGAIMGLLLVPSLLFHCSDTNLPDTLSVCIHILYTCLLVHLFACTQPLTGAHLGGAIMGLLLVPSILFHCTDTNLPDTLSACIHILYTCTLVYVPCTQPLSGAHLGGAIMGLLLAPSILFHCTDSNLPATLSVCIHILYTCLLVHLFACTQHLTGAHLGGAIMGLLLALVLLTDQLDNKTNARIIRIGALAAGTHATLHLCPIT